MFYHRLCHIAVSVAAVFLSSFAAGQATQFAVCPSPFYLSQGSRDSIQLFSGNPDASGGVAFTEVDAPQAPKLDYNAIAFRESDRFMYGLRSNSSSAVTGPDAHLIRIGANAEIEDLGAIAGMPDAFYLAGDMSPTGEYYVLSATARSTLVTLDLGAGPVSGAATTVTTVGLNDGAGGPLEINSGDIAFADGRLWGLHLSGSGQWYLAEINVTTGEITLAPNPTGISNPFGALWGTPDAVYGNANDGAGFFYFDLNTGKATQIATSNGAARNDAARCVSNRPIFPADIAITKDNGQSEYTPEQTVVYTIDVSNQGLFGAVGVQVEDPLPANVNSATWTCTSQIGDGVCRAASGSGAINAIVDLPAGSSVRFELSFTLDPGFSGDLVNTVTATLPNNAGAPLQAQDSDTSNNSATDRDSSPAGPQAVPVPMWVIAIQGLFLLLLGVRKLKPGRFRGQ
ncbi:DUF11 domain-containing protein [uncultured Pseudoteredinibacter sp.]|uniref:DUF11 domain-containing protein n=1 Tax=uncultured Pseudoteredinibacter sp. TaxID=1641701 RepID=UPI0026331FF3|nr:DUF11 domain-containing protein [uncultured Pseudoteredinibacter sp.]